MEIYTREQWSNDRELKAMPGQEIEESIYDAILNVLEPLPLPPKTARQAEKQYGISVNAGFLLREPYDICNEGYTYLAFAMGGNGKENHCYYLGLSSTKQAHFDLPDRF